MSSSGDVSRATWARRQRACARVTSPLAFLRAFVRETLAQFADRSAARLPPALHPSWSTLEPLFGSPEKNIHPDTSRRFRVMGPVPADHEFLCSFLPPGFWEKRASWHTIKVFYGMGIEALCAAPSLQVGPVAVVGVGHLQIVRHRLV